MFNFVKQVNYPATSMFMQRLIKTFAEPAVLTANENLAFRSKN
ncbi:hypothetical protein P4278_33380 [Bacillus thuringiensis]|nr:hypothetical protein [Bacillus thuringiensis]MED2784465.1 hypothetical protein [Bacillus thuringiensis]